MADFDYDEDIKIDPTQLDVEWIRQPRLYKKYSDEASFARDKLARAKEALDVAGAILATDIRKNPSVYGMEKVTESSVWEKVTTYKGPVDATWADLALDFNRANEHFLKMKLECDLIQGALTSVEQRKYALENMVRLLNQNYFSTPTTPRDVGSAWNDHLAKKTGEDTVNKLRERRQRRSAD